MVFSKSFPKTEGTYTIWEEVYLSKKEEKDTENNCHDENIVLMKECVEDARKIFSEKNLKDFQSDVINIAIALFEKRASHSIYWKENLAKEKFDKSYGQK
ncbi:hypothetical protein CMO90_02450 [Candidatus Woesearchaeota archaeon]|jgi:hypothetical protein|nr:hypothetical protein [Candidatus Woesearchaeota archaeon]|tara:strand:- start:505 stop:804 length:300 start_codon:yes stop_codon:yes gene_type:complete